MEPYHDRTLDGGMKRRWTTIYPTPSDVLIQPSNLMKQPSYGADEPAQSTDLLMSREQAMRWLAASDQTNSVRSPSSDISYWTPSLHGRPESAPPTMVSSPGSGVLSPATTWYGNVPSPSTDLASADGLLGQVDFDHSLEYEIHRDMGMIWREQPVLDTPLTLTGAEIPFEPSYPGAPAVLTPSAYSAGSLDTWTSSDSVFQRPAPIRRPSTVDELRHWGDRLRAQTREHLDMLVQDGPYVAHCDDVSAHDMHTHHCWAAKR
jgi:hypothetical protein